MSDGVWCFKTKFTRYIRFLVKKMNLTLLNPEPYWFEFVLYIASLMAMSMD